MTRILIPLVSAAHVRGARPASEHKHRDVGLADDRFFHDPATDGMGIRFRTRVRSLGDLALLV